MLEHFLAANRETIIARAMKRVAAGETPKPSEEELKNGIPVFLDQLGDALRRERAGRHVNHAELKRTAGRHGADLLGLGLTVAQVVSDYGDVCQAITEVAVEQKASITAADYKTLNLCLDEATAHAVTEFTRLRERAASDEGTERLGVLAHEMRNLLLTATLSFTSIKNGRVGANGSTGDVLLRSLLGLQTIVDRSLTEVRLASGRTDVEVISIASLIEELEVGALLQAEARGVRLSVAPVDQDVTIEGDRQILAGAIANLVQNACKFTRQRGQVRVAAHSTEDRVAFEIEDECGGLPPGRAEDLFDAFEQRGADRSGIGLGLLICAKAAKAHQGEVRVRNVPGKGCVFVLDLPRRLVSPGASGPDADGTDAR